MRTVVAWLVATVALLMPLALAAAPPEDVAAYCQATYPQMQFQVRCFNVENAAAERVSRSAPSADRDAFNRCLGTSPSWAAMEACLVHSARGAAMEGVPGLMSAPAATARVPSTSPERDSPVASPPAGPTAATPAPPADSMDAGAPSGSTVVLGPQPGMPAVVVENRPTWPIPEADAERHLRGVLERAGTPAARCTKKQYGPGWVIICE